MLATTPAQQTPVTPTGCCPPFDPATWHEREVTWHDRAFVKAHVSSFFHLPLNMGRKITQAVRAIDAAGAAPPERLMLADEDSPWRTELYIDVRRPVPGLELARLSGTFLTRVYDGPFRDERKWAADMSHRVAELGRQLEKIYFGYTTCPACARAYGHNYVVVFAKVGDVGEAPALAATP